MVLVSAFAILQSTLSGVAAISADAKSLSWMATQALTREFLSQAALLPREAIRTLFRDKTTREWSTAVEAARLSDSQRANLQSSEWNEDGYYQTKYGSPLTYLPMMEILGSAGLTSIKGKRILDFGYGMVGQLRMWSLAGANAVGVDVDPFLLKLYSARSDQGRLGPGSVKLVHGFFPTEPAVKASVGGGYDLIVSKNTLKLGYIHPRREAPKAQLIDLGVSDEIFVRELWNRLKPGGYVLIYNISPAQNPPDKPYIPWADGETAFARSVWTEQGFQVLAFDQKDDDRCRAMFKALGYDQGPNGREDLRSTTFTHYTLVRKL